LRDNYEWADENKRQISEVRSNRDEGEAAGEPVDLLMKKVYLLPENWERNSRGRRCDGGILRDSENAGNYR